MVRSFSAYSEAHAEAERVVRDLARGDQSAALTPQESADALAIRQALDGYRTDTGKRVSALQAVTAYLGAARKLGDRSLDEAVRGYLQTVVVVKPKALAEAVAEFLAARERRATASGGRRPEISTIYVRSLTRFLTEFAEAMSGHALTDLTRNHLDLYLDNLGKLSPKSRNDRRAALRMFIKWAVSRDYLPVNHRLLETDSMKVEDDTPERIECYTASELRTWLDGTDGEMRAVIALQALAGLRLLEVLRLTWEDVFRIPGHCEISASKAKTRSRRLVEICPALEQWLAPYRGRTGMVWTQTPSAQGCINAMQRCRAALGIPPKRNGLRHGFVSAHFALYQNENATAAQGGNSPAMVHRDYKGLLTKTEAEAWFKVTPATTAENIIMITKGTAA